MKKNGKKAVASAVEFAPLEARLLMCLTPNGPDHCASCDLQNNVSLYIPSPIVQRTLAKSTLAKFMHGGGTILPESPVIDGGTTESTIAANVPVSQVPVLHSHPSSTHKLYLDFMGAAAFRWGSYSVPATPAYTQDNDTTTFSPTELNSINEIWARVAEKFSPFDLDVTTENPGSFAPKTNVRAVIGGAGGWYAPAGGVSFVGGYNDPNAADNATSVFAFTANLGNGNPHYTAEAVSHESGHSFGLVHQSTYSGTTKTAEYRNGGPDISPIMGVSYYSTRGLWAKGQSSTSSTSIQDDLAIISSNNFGYRADDYGNDASTADLLSADVNGAVSANGVVEKTSDQDWFSFSTLSGPVNFTVAPASLGAMLHATLELVNQDGTVITTASASSLGQTLSASVLGGTYDVVVGSFGAYGDIGQYSLSGTLPLDPNYVLAPTGVTAAVSSGQVNVSWTDNADNDTGEIVQRSDDGGNSWNAVATLPAGSTNFSDPNITVGQQYSYEVKATGAVEDSQFSSTVTAGIIPAAPTSVATTPFAGGEVDVTWAPSDGASGYKIERSNGTTWTLAGTASAGATTFACTGLAGATTYSFRVTATSSAGNSAASSVVTGLTTPAAPVTLSGAVISTTQINLTWAKPPGATGFHVERKIDGADWSLLATLGSTVLTYSNTGLTAATTYQYRVKAFNASGDSLPSTAVTKETLLATPTGLTPIAPSPHEVDITWNAVTGAAGYKLECASGTNTTYSILLNTSDPTVLSFTHLNLAGGTKYTYRLTALGVLSNSVPALASTITKPLAPTVLTATAVSPTQVTLKWSAALGAGAYKIESSADSGQTWSQIAATAASVLTYSVTGLTVNTGVTYRVRAANASGDGEYSPVASTTTLVTAPTGVSAAPQSAGRVTIAWSAVDGATGYKVEKAAVGSTAFTVVGTVDANTTAFDATGLIGGTTYQFRVRASNPGGDSAPSIVSLALTNPLAPVTLTAAAVAPTKINLAWSASVSATGYKIERADDGVTFTQIATTTATVRTYLDTSAIENTTYTYRVRATNATGDSEPSSTAAATPTDANNVLSPTNLIATLSGFKVALSWTDNSNNEAAFKVQRSANSGTTWNDLATTVANVKTYTDGTAVRGTSYQYRVQATNPYISSDYSNTANILTPPPDVTTLHATGATSTSVSLAWTDVLSETGFTIQKYADALTGWTTAGTADQGVTTFIAAGLNPGKAYSFRIKSTNAGGDSSFSIALAKFTVPAAPASLTATAVSPTQINLAWTNVDGETAFKLERSTDGATWTPLAAPAKGILAYADKTAVTGTAYSYRVSAIDASGTSDPSTTATATATSDLAVLAPSGLSATYVSGHIALTWTNNATNQTGFIMQRSTNHGLSYVDLPNPTAANVTTYNDAAIVRGATYTYRVAAFDQYMRSAPTDPQTITAPLSAPAAPTMLPASALGSLFSTTPVTLAADVGPQLM
jgi:large repetitive protein